MSIRTITIEIALSDDAMRLIIKGGKAMLDADGPQCGELERKGIIALHGEAPEFDGYYLPTEMCPIIRKALKAKYVIVDRRIYVRDEI